MKWSSITKGIGAFLLSVFVAGRVLADDAPTFVGCHKKQIALSSPPPPTASASASTTEINADSAVLTIDKDQHMFLGGQAVSLSDLPTRLRELNTDPAHRVIYLPVDERVPFGALTSVMDAVKQAGYTNINIVTQPLNHAAK